MLKLMADFIGNGGVLMDKEKWSWVLKVPYRCTVLFCALTYIYIDSNNDTDMIYACFI
jgi:hypothetical protein